MTSRSKSYGAKGDVVDSPVGRLRLTAVYREPLGVVAEHWFREEGCASPEEFADVWREIHPRKGFDPAQEVWVHRFEVVA